MTDDQVLLQTKIQRFTLVAELHRSGITSARVIGELLGISREYARQIRHKLGLRHPRNRGEALALLSTELRLRVEGCCKLPTESSAAE